MNISVSNSISFEKLFGEIVSHIDSVISEIEKKQDSPMYGVYNVDYKLRYITPENMMTFTDNIVNMIKGKVIQCNVADYEMFATESVKRFLKTNGSYPLNESSGNADVFVNPKEMCLDDILTMVRQRVPNISVYSREDMNDRLAFVKEDIKKLKELKFTHAMRNIVNNIDKISKAICTECGDMMLMHTIQEFILFSSALLLNTLDEIIGYMSPKAGYDLKDIQEACYDDEDVEPYYVTECCLLKTNDMTLKSRIPFNCNIRNIVLGDTTEMFEDTLRALKFITSSSKSPISHLILNELSEDDMKEFNKSYNFREAEKYIRMNSNESNPCHVDNIKDDKMPSGDSNRIDAQFRTSSSWLNVITSGNNYLDGNYRRDAIGNNEKHPITTSLDFLYKSYNPCDACESKE